MSPEELLYYRERALIERQRAAEATHPYVVDIHHKLASLYEKLVGMESGGEPEAQNELRKYSGSN